MIQKEYEDTKDVSEDQMPLLEGLIAAAMGSKMGFAAQGAIVAYGEGIAVKFRVEVKSPEEVANCEYPLRSIHPSLEVTFHLQDDQTRGEVGKVAQEVLESLGIDKYVNVKWRIAQHYLLNL